MAEGAKNRAITAKNTAKEKVEVLVTSNHAPDKRQ
jgi:hypothetical protein